MAIKLKKWDVTEHLNTKEDIRLYIEASLEEDEGNGVMIRRALSNVARAKGMGGIAKQIGISREGLYKALSESGNPSFMLMIKLTHALGFNFHLSNENSTKA